MLPSVCDTCFLYTPKFLSRSSQSSNVPREIVCLQTGDTVYACNKAFTDLEDRMSTEFDTKPAKFLAEGKGLNFNGAIISRRNKMCSLTQASHIQKLAQLDVNNATKAN